jgi:hypothetical protein
LPESSATADGLLEQEPTAISSICPDQATAKNAAHSRPAIEEYIAFQDTDLKDPKYLSLEAIQADLVRIVAVEGPATEATVIDRYRVATRYGRFKGPTRDHVLAALRSAADRGILMARPDYPSAEVMVYTIPGQPEIRVRTRGPRDLSEVPMGEIIVHATEAIRSGLSPNHEASYRLLLDIFGLKRLTDQAKSRLEIAFELASQTSFAGEGIERAKTNS